MSSTIINAAPMGNLLGTQDLSTRVLPPIPEVLPTHLPKIYCYAQKGPVTPQLVSGADMVNMYGSDSFDLRKSYATHATVLANLVNAQGNAIMFERVEPADAAPPANIRLYLDVLPTMVPVYQRNSDGSYKVDVNNVPLLASPAATVAGFSVMWKAAPVPVDNQGNSLFGAGEPIPGTQTDASTHAQSTMYPIMDLVVSNFGAYGNNIGLQMYAPTSMSSAPLDPRLITDAQAYPFRMACVSRPDSATSPSTVVTQSAEQYVNVTFKPNTIDKNFDTLVGISDVFIQAYSNLNTPGYLPVYGPFGQVHVYDGFVATLLAEFYAAETPYFSATGSDFLGIANEEYVFNMISGVSSTNIPYTSFVVLNGSGSIKFTPNTTVYAVGGSDGTMNETLFGGLVANLVTAYADPTSVLQDTAKYPESILWDSGFPLATKYAMTSFISIRKDTALVLSTHDVTGPVLSASEESSLAIALRTHIQMFPESDYFGTPALRAMIVGRSGTLVNSQYTKPLPIALELATKAATYMGAGNGHWKAGSSFDRAPNNNVTMFININVTFTPDSVRNTDWSNGLVWAESFDRSKNYWPALKTVYDNDTSVLTSFFTMMCVVELEKVGERARRQYSGASDLTNAQLAEKVNGFINDNVKDRFDGRYVIIPDTYFTAADVARGYSWSCSINLYSPNMKTVQTLSITAYRIDQVPKV